MAAGSRNRPDRAHDNYRPLPRRMKLVSYVSHQQDGAHVGAEEADELPQGTGLRRSADCDAHMKAGDEATARLLLFPKRLEACYERRHFGNARQPRHRAWGGHVKGSCGSAIVQPFSARCKAFRL